MRFDHCMLTSWHMVSELQTVVVEHPNSVLCARDCRSADPRAVEVAVLDQRDFRRAFFIPARRFVRPMADASCPVRRGPGVPDPPAARPTCALGEQDLISAEHSGLSLPLPPLFKTDFYNPALRPYQPTRVRACKRHSPVVREPC